MVQSASLFSEDVPSFAQTVESADKQLFRAIVTIPGHAPHHSLPRVKSTRYNVLHPRTHNFEPPLKDNRNFMARQLYANNYWAKQS